MSRRDGAIYVGRLSKNTRIRDLEDIFEPYGRLLRCDIKYGSEMAYAFIDFEDRRDAEDCVKYEHGRELNGQSMIVEWAKGGRDRRLSYDECFRCRRVGHWARDCPELRWGRRGGGGGGGGQGRWRSPSPKRRSRSRSRDRKRKSRSRSRDRRRRSRSRSRDHRSRSRSDDRKRSRSRSGSRDRKSRSRSRDKSGSRDRKSNSRDRKKSVSRSKSRSRSRSKSPRRSKSGSKSTSRSPRQAQAEKDVDGQTNGEVNKADHSGGDSGDGLPHGDGQRSGSESKD